MNQGLGADVDVELVVDVLVVVTVTVVVVLAVVVVTVVVVATKALAISGPFGNTIATRSPRPIPNAFSAVTVAVMCARIVSAGAAPPAKR